MPKITIIGGGNVGTTLGILFSRYGYEIIDVLSRTAQSAERSRRAIGAGRAVNRIEALAPADIYVVTTSDNSLYAIGEELAQSMAIQSGAIVFHCSGATPSSVFDRLRSRGARVASVHPVKTFTAPSRDAETFPGTWCGIEGDAEALAILEPLFKTIGAHTFHIDGENKTLYHTAIVFICNYLFPLIEVGLECYERAGVDRAVATQVIEPILHATVANALSIGPARALTGPIARGDDVVVRRQLEALGEFKPEFQTLYKLLGRIATDLSVEKGVASPERIEAIRSLLS